MSCVLVKPDAINFLLDNFFDLIPVGAMLYQRPCGKHPILCGSRQYSTRRRAFSCAVLQINLPKWPLLHALPACQKAEINEMSL